MVEYNDGKDNDGDGYFDFNGGGEELLSDEKCRTLNSIGERINYNLEDEVFVRADKGARIWLDDMIIDIGSGILPKNFTIRIIRIPAVDENTLSFNDQMILG